MDVSCAFLRGKPREVKELSFFEPPSRGLPGIEKGALIEMDGGKATLSMETHGHLSNWTLLSSVCATFLDVSSE